MALQVIVWNEPLAPPVTLLCACSGSAVFYGDNWHKPPFCLASF